MTDELYNPAIAMELVFICFVSAGVCASACGREPHAGTENAAESGLLKTALLLIPLTLIGMVLFFAAGMAAGRLHGVLPMILAQTVPVGLSALVEYRLAGRFALKKTKRILAALLMLLLYIAETVLLIWFGSGMTT
ncbi:MAG: hypothetical protein J5851_10030 [Oscillospiraceae bacterium]|nr:hypothetical protein [Oscillospiraceae bacterium]